MRGSTRHDLTHGGDLADFKWVNDDMDDWLASMNPYQAGEFLLRLKELTDRAIQQHIDRVSREIGTG